VVVVVVVVVVVAVVVVVVVVCGLCLGPRNPSPSIRPVLPHWLGDCGDSHAPR
jgi:hypothetical protein